MKPRIHNEVQNNSEMAYFLVVPLKLKIYVLLKLQTMNHKIFPRCSRFVYFRRVHIPAIIVRQPSEDVDDLAESPARRRRHSGREYVDTLITVLVLYGFQSGLKYLG